MLITYDLNSPGQKYEKLHEAIKSIPAAWCHLLDSTWLVAGSTLTPEGVYGAIKPHLDASDRALVLNVTGDSHQGWLTPDAWAWIRTNVSP
jgi:hypothetical protein